MSKLTAQDNDYLSTAETIVDDDGNDIPCRTVTLDGTYTEDDVRARLIPFLESWLKEWGE